MLSLHPRHHRFRNENVYIGVYQHPYRLAGSVFFTHQRTDLDAGP